MALSNRCMCAGWIWFDQVASYWLGLDESKYEWALIEREYQQQQDMDNLAFDNIQHNAQASSMEQGRSLANSPARHTAPEALEMAGHTLPQSTGATLSNGQTVKPLPAHTCQHAGQ